MTRKFLIAYYNKMKSISESFSYRFDGSMFDRMEDLTTKTSKKIILVDLEYIVCSANWYTDLKIHEHQPINIETGFVTTGLRHCNCIQIFSMIQKDVNRADTVKLMNNCTQGFLTSKNRFVDRTEAANIAFNAGQIKKEIKKLHSEDLF